MGQFWQDSQASSGFAGPVLLRRKDHPPRRYAPPLPKGELKTLPSCARASSYHSCSQFPVPGSRQITKHGNRYFLLKEGQYMCCPYHYKGHFSPQVAPPTLNPKPGPLDWAYPLRSFGFSSQSDDPLRSGFPAAMGQFRQLQAYSIKDLSKLRLLQRSFTTHNRSI